MGGSIKLSVDLLYVWKIGDNESMTPYIFFIGFNKTATYSLAKFFKANGYSSIHWDEGKLALKMKENIDRGLMVLTGYDEEYTVYLDLIYESQSLNIEANSFFRELDCDYPESYFVLNTRPLDEWIESRVKQLNGEFLERQMILMNRSKEQVIEAWKAMNAIHEIEVRKYFKQNPRFTEIDISIHNVPKMLSNLLEVSLNSEHWEKLNVTQ